MKRIQLLSSLFVMFMLSGCVMMSDSQIHQSVDKMKMSDGISRREAVLLAQKHILDHESIKNEIFSLKPIKIRIVKDEENSSTDSKQFLWKLTFYAKNRRVVSTPLPLDRFHITVDAETGTIRDSEFEAIK